MKAIPTIAKGAALSAFLFCAACATTPITVGPQPTTGPAITTQAPSLLAGVAQFSDTDLKTSEAELIAANGGAIPTTPPLSDDYQCVSWADASLPGWLAQLAAATPNGAVKGPISLFIAGKIAVYKGQQIVNDATNQLMIDFAHNCGAAVSLDAQFIQQALAKFGVNVVLPAAVTGATGGLVLPGLPQL